MPAWVIPRKGAPVDKHLTRDEQARLVAGDLSEARAAELRDHLEHCPRCAREADAYASVASFLGERPRTSLPAHFASRLRVRLAEVRLRQPSPHQIRARRTRLALGVAAGALALLVAVVVSHVHLRPAGPTAPTHVATRTGAPHVRPEETPPNHPRLPGSGTRAAGTAVTRQAGPLAAGVPSSGESRRSVAATPNTSTVGHAHVALPGATHPAASRPQLSAPARIVSMKGAPMVVGGHAGKQRSASLEGGLRAGESLRGGEVDRALVRWDDGCEIATGYNTEVRVLGDGDRNRARLRLERGRLWVWAPGDGTGLTIETPAGVAEIKRGEAIVGIGFLAQPGASNAATVVAAFSGQSAFRARSGEVALGAGHSIRAWTAERVEDPRPIVAPEALRRGLLWGSEYHVWREWGPRREEVLSLVAAPRAALGITPEPLPATGGGVTVHRVEADSRAARAHVQPGDVVQSLDGHPLRSQADLLTWELLAQRPPARAAVRRGQTSLGLALDWSLEPPALPWPRQVAPLLRASVVSLAAGDLAGARAQLRLVLSRDSRCAAAYYNLGLISAYEDQWPEAAAANHRAVDLAPEVGLVHRSYGRSLLAIANLDAAVRELRRALVLEGEDPVAGYLLGRSLLVGGDRAAATAEAQRLLTRANGRALGELLLGDIAAMGGQHKEAVVHSRMALQIDVGNVDAKTQVALELDAAGDHDGAEREARELLSWDPTSFRATNLIGSIHLRSRDFGVAEEWLQRARALRPDLPYAHSNMAALYLYTRAYAQSEASYREALRISDEIPATHIGFAWLLRATQRAGEAETHYLLALQLDPSNRQALDELTALYRSSQREEAALALLARYDLPHS